MEEMKLKCGEILTVGESLGIPVQEKNYEEQPPGIRN